MNRSRASVVAALLVSLAFGRGASGEDVAPARPPGISSPAPTPTQPRTPSLQPTPEQAADAVLVAVNAKDEATLSALAAQNDPDPWLVAEELIRRDEWGAADGFSKAARRKDVEQLPDYVASRRGKPDDGLARAALLAANAALAGGDAKSALQALASVAGEEGTLVAVRISFARGAAQRLGVRLAESAASYRAAAEAAERLGWLARAARALYEAGRAAHGGGDFRGALSAFEQELRVEGVRGSRPGVIAALQFVGNLRYLLGDYEAALKSYQRSLDEMEALGDHANSIVALENIGSIHTELGDYATALQCYARALVEVEALGDRAGAALTLANIGNVHLLLGNYAKALDFDERALSGQNAAGERAGAAVTLGNIGSVHLLLGNHAKALELYERAMKEQEALGSRAQAARTLGRIGSVYAALGKYAEALEIYERARKQMQTLGDRAGVAATLGNIGSAHRALGDAGKALESYEQAMTQMSALGDRAGAALTLARIGIVHASRGNHAKALEVFEPALTQLQELGDRAGAALALGQIASCHEALGQWAKARDAARQGVLLLPTLVSGLGEQQGAEARAQYRRLFAVGIRAAAATREIEQAGFFVESGRAGSLLESFAARGALQTGLLPPELVTAAAEARVRAAACVRAYQVSLDAGDLAATRARHREMAAAQEAVGSAIERIQREAKRAASVLYPRAASLEVIRSTLQPAEVLVLFALTDTMAVALVVTAREARIVPLPSSTQDVEAACAAFDPANSTTDSASAIAALRTAVIEPLGLSDDVRRVLVSPDGALSYVPFAVLLGDREVAYVPSGTTYGLLREERDLRGDGILALGDPDYASRVDERALAANRTGARLARLPGTRDEAKAVGTVTLLGTDASEPGFRRAVATRPRWRAVHFACHGLIDAAHPAFSSLALTPDGEDDGFLTAIEVFRSSIPADLVVLSACETGKGAIIDGEGIVGLTRAFMFAGAPRVLCSLWKVDDDATRALMTKFYELWNPKDGRPGVPTAAALKQAQAFVHSQEKWSHPYYWAAWALWGLPN
jgi:CHAT domain-containing protein/tetratricopeptide (TPR) repeat protein